MNVSLMSTYIACIVAFLIFIALVLLQVITKSKRPIKKAFMSMFMGVFALGAVNISGIFTGVTIPVSFLSIFLAVVAGIPGTTLILLLNTIM